MTHASTPEAQSMALAANASSNANQPQVQVLPYLIPNKPGVGVVASLTNLGLPDQISVSLPAPAFPSNPAVTLTTQTVDATAAATAGFGGLISVSGSASATYMICEISSSVTRPGRAGSLILNETWGYAYRMCVKAWGFSGNLSLQAIAANCTVSGAGSAFQIQVIGVPFAKLLGTLTPLTTMATGKFDMSQMEQLGVIQAQLNELILDEKYRGTPELLSVQLNLAAITAPYNDSPSTLLALSGIGDGHNYQATIAKQPKASALPAGMSINTAKVQQIYTATGVGLTATPNGVQQNNAKKDTFRGQKY